MATTAEYLNKLVTQKNTLADNLVTKGVSATHDETLETLVPKVLDISGGGGGGNGIYPIDEHGFPTGDVVIPDGVTSLGQSGYTLFARSSMITSISCPHTVTKIASSVCKGLINMTRIIGIDNVTQIGDGAFQNCEKLNISLPQSITVIENSAFRNCSSITEITIPALTSWGTTTFYQCTSLRTVKFSNDFTFDNIPIHTFNGCKLLKSINIPLSVTKINSSVFANSGLESIVIHHNVTWLDASVFSGCTSLSEISLPNTIAYVNASNNNNNTFSNCTALTTVNLEQDFNCSISFYSSANITNAADMLTKLKDLTGETAKTITFAKAVYDGLTADEIAVATNKNWTVASYGS